MIVRREGLRSFHQRITPRLFISVVTLSSLGVAGLLSVSWFFNVRGPSRFEPAVQSLGLLAGILGLVLERRAATMEQRRQRIAAIAGELQANQAILSRPPFVSDSPPTTRTVYPRLHLSAVDAALSSEVLDARGDKGLTEQLHRWRNRVDLFNHQLNLAEILAFLNGSDEVLRQLHDGLHSPDGSLTEVRQVLHAVVRCLPDAVGGRR